MLIVTEHSLVQKVTKLIFLQCYYRYSLLIQSFSLISISGIRYQFSFKNITVLQFKHYASDLFV